MMTIALEKSKYHRFSLKYDYSHDRIEFCRMLKESFGWQKFSFENMGELKRWVFSDSLLVPVIQERFPEVEISSEVEAIVEHEQKWSLEQKQRARTIDIIRTKTDSNLVVKGLKKDLYPYQKVGVEFLGASGGRAIIADAPGLGKTAQSLAFIKHSGFKRSLIVSPASVKFSWANEVKKWTGLSAVVIDGKTDLAKIDADVNIWITNYDILKKHHPQLSKIHFDCIVGDECFVAGTMVDTANGSVPIEQIKAGDIVRNAVGFGRVISTSVKVSSDLMRVTIGGTPLVCTHNHPFLTQTGWVRACELNQAHVIIKQHEALRILRREGSEQGMPLLREVLLGEVEDETAIYKEDHVHEGDKRDEKYMDEEGSFVKPRYRKTGICEDDEVKSHEGGSDKRENVSDSKKNRSQASSKGWKWNGSNSGRTKDSVVFGRTCCVQHSCKDTRKGWEWISYLLQDRYWDLGYKVWGGVRWLISWTSFSTGSGQKEDEKVEGVRVDSVEVLESDDIKQLGGSGKGVNVYNLQVSGHPSYSVNGSLVHNCHLIKNPQAIRTKAFRSISRSINSTVLLSGTPLLSRPSELFSLLNVVDPKTWNNWHEYARKYCDAKLTRWGLDTSGVSNAEELHARIKRYFLRRKKEEVLTDLPPKIFIDTPVSLDKETKAEYDAAATDLATYLRRYAGKQPKEIAKTMQAEKLARLNVLRMLNAMGKVEVTKDIANSIIDADEKVLIFSSFVAPLEKLKEYYGSSAVMLTGQTPVELRGEIVKAFQENPKVKVFLSGIKSGGVGITLTAASNVIFLDYSWNPGDMIQAQDRVHRIGQKAESCNIYQLYAPGSIDEDLREMLAEKQDTFDKVIDGKESESAGTNAVEAAAQRVLRDYKDN